MINGTCDINNKQIDDECVRRQNSAYFLVDVLLSEVFDQTFTYGFYTNDATNIEKICPINSVVVVEFRTKITIGIVLNISRGYDSKEELISDRKIEYNLRMIIDTILIPPVKDTFLNFLFAFASYNLAQRGIAIKMVYGILANGWKKFNREMAKKNIETQVFKNGKKSIKTRKIDIELQCNSRQQQMYQLDSQIKEILLSKSQENVVNNIWESWENGRNRNDVDKDINIDIDIDINLNIYKNTHKNFQTKKRETNIHLLHGVTGSGKTEVFLSIVQKIVRDGGQAILLVPEIMLTTQLITRVRQYIPSVASWHSAVTPAKKREILREIYNGNISFMIGARSALFLPFSNLQCIIVDEEHDSSYKQIEVPVYHARDMAVLRGKYDQALVILASATPSIESVYNCYMHKYHMHRLFERFSGVQMPLIRIVKSIDIRAGVSFSDTNSPIIRNRHLRWFTRDAFHAISAALIKKEKILLFLNRKGYAPIVMCEVCRTNIKCENCDISMVFYKRDKKMHCHYCGSAKEVPKICNNCDAEGKFIGYGGGVEQLAEEIGICFPQAEIMTLASDNIGNQNAAQELLKRIEISDSLIIIGTQIISKGLNFNNLNLVVIVDVTTKYLGYDFRGLEKLHQLLHQVIGRAGRQKVRGEVIIQADDPNARVLKALQSYDIDTFVNEELMHRKNAQMPPYTGMMNIGIDSKERTKLLSFVRDLMYEISLIYPQIINTDTPHCDVNGENTGNQEHIKVLGPLEVPKTIGRYRYRITVIVAPKAVFSKITKSFIQIVENAYKRNKASKASVKVKFDVDPLS